MILLLFCIFSFCYSDPYKFTWDSGGVGYNCEDLGDNWILAGNSCFYPCTTTHFNFSVSGTVCNSSQYHYSVAAIVDNWLIARSLYSKVPCQIYWTGIIYNESTLYNTALLDTISIYNPLWAADQPPNNQNGKHCLALDLINDTSLGWRLFDCRDFYPVLCQTFACLTNQYRCKDNSRCIPLSAVNDQFPDCPDGSDEQQASISLLKSFTQTNCRHVLLKGSGEFSYSVESHGPVNCQWDIEASPEQVLAFTIEGYTSDLTVENGNKKIFLPSSSSFSQLTKFTFLTFRFNSQTGSDFKVKFYSTEANPCLISEGVALYDSMSSPFDCSFHAYAPIQTQFLLFIVESISKSSSVVVNVTGAGYSFSFTAPVHNQAVVIPASDASLVVQDAWKSSIKTSFRIRVIPFGSICLVIPLTIPALSLHWPPQPSATFVPHCISFAFIGKKEHTWKLDNLLSTRTDFVSLKAKDFQLAITGSCSYSGKDMATLEIKQLSSDFTVSFKVSQDCEWAGRTFSWGSEVACLDGSLVESVECEMGGTWSIPLADCLNEESPDSSTVWRSESTTVSTTPTSTPEYCILPVMDGAYPISVDFIDGGFNATMSFKCYTGYFAPEAANCDSSTWSCNVTCTNGVWSPTPNCGVINCKKPKSIYNDANLSTCTPNNTAFASRCYYDIPEGKFFPGRPFAQCLTQDDPQHPGWTYVPNDFNFTDIVCLAYPVLYGHFKKVSYTINSTGEIECISGYIISDDPPFCYEDRTWSNPNVTCTWNSTMCGPGKVLTGPPSNRTCEEINPCKDGTHLCDSESTCNFDTTLPLKHSCSCPDDKTMYTGPQKYGLYTNVTCIHRCTISDIYGSLSLYNSFLFGYTDPPDNINVTTYCKKILPSAGNHTAYIKNLSQNCSDIFNNGVINACNYSYPSIVPSAPPHVKTLSYTASIFGYYKIGCESNEVLIGSSNFYASTREYKFFNYWKENPINCVTCKPKQCSDLTYIIPWHFNGNETDLEVGSTAYLPDDYWTPSRMTCTLDGTNPVWDTSCISFSNGTSTFSFPQGCNDTVDHTSPPAINIGLTPTAAGSVISKTAKASFFSSNFLPTLTSTFLSTTTITSSSDFSKNPDAVSSTFNCSHDLNSCPNGSCDLVSGSCNCIEVNGSCVPDPKFFWCSSKGTYNNATQRCDCHPGYGKGGYNVSFACIDGPIITSCSSVALGSNFAFTAIADETDILEGICVEEVNKTISINGSTNTTCACLNGGKCVEMSGPNTLPCNCLVPWVGERCETNAACFFASQNYTVPVCQNGGTCKPSDKSFECECPFGWNGTRCDQLEVNPCDEITCSRHGQCKPINNNTDYFCYCDVGFTDQNCSTPVNYCDYYNPCFDQSHCKNNGTSADVYCDCTNGYEEPYCTPPDPSNVCSSQPCGKSVYCEALLYPDYYCECNTAEKPENYSNTTKSQLDCDGVNDYCVFNPCFNNGTCTSFDDGQVDYSCNCDNTGFAGKNCEINCAQNCLNGATCNTTDNGLKCSCPEGFSGDRCEVKTCDDITPIDGECTYPGFLCQNGGTCNVTCQGSHPISQCNCPQLTSGDYCEIINKSCTSDYCKNGGECIDGIGVTPYCDCTNTAGYYGDRCQLKKTSSFNLLWTGYQSTQTFVSKQIISTLFKQFTLCGWVQYSTYFSSETPPEPFMGIIYHENQDALIVDNKGVTKNNTRIFNVNINSLRWHHVCIRSPNPTDDRQYWSYFLDGNLVQNVTDTSLPYGEDIFYMVSLAPGNSFRGELSLVQLFTILLTEDEVADLAYDCVNALNNFQSSEDLAVNWMNFTTVNRGNPGVVQIQPGICEISSCLPGRPCGTKDKISPVVISCPKYQSVAASGTYTIVSWDSPVFQDNVGVTSVTSNFRSGQTFPWGYYQVIYVAKDAGNNTAQCQFSVMVAPNNCTFEHPDGATVANHSFSEENSLMYADVTCNDIEFPKPDPEFFVCDGLGQWSRVSSFSSGHAFHFPSCGTTSNPVQNLNGSVITNGTSCVEIYNTLYNALNATLGGFCNDCFTIFPLCDTTDMKVIKRGLRDTIQEELFYIATVNNTRELLLPSVNNSVAAAFPNGQVQTSATYDCTDLNHPIYFQNGNSNSCGDCAPGTWYNGTNCKDCPADTYREGPSIGKCTPCDENYTTGGLTKASSASMCYKKCDMGYYYDFSKKDCTLCPFATYQDSVGSTECIPCPLYYSTIILGENTKFGCNYTCPIGQQFKSDGSNECEPCPQGTYKNTTAGPCVLCPIGRTTLDNNMTKETDCNVMNCPKNTMVGKYSWPIPPDLYVYEFCPTCPMGTYTDKTNATKCEPCESEDQAPTCSMVSDCSPHRSSSCTVNFTCEQATTPYPTNIPIYSCSEVTVNPGNTKSVKAIVIIAIIISVLVIIVALAVITWIFRDKFLKRDDGLDATNTDVYRVARYGSVNRAMSIASVSSGKSSVDTTIGPYSVPLERSRQLPPPVITDRSALAALPSRRSPLQMPYAIPRISETITPRSLSADDDDPVVRTFNDAESEEDDDYFG